jgi:hypothetical protein
VPSLEMRNTTQSPTLCQLTVTWPPDNLRTAVTTAAVNAWQILVRCAMVSTSSGDG